MHVFPQVLKAWTLLQQRIQKRQEETRSSHWDRFQHFQNWVTIFLSWSVQKHATAFLNLPLVTFINKWASISSYLGLLMCWMRFGTENTSSTFNRPAICSLTFFVLIVRNVVTLPFMDFCNCSFQWKRLWSWS